MEKKLQIILLLVGVAVSLSLGVIIGWFSKGDASAVAPSAAAITDGPPTSLPPNIPYWQQMLIDNIKADKIKDNLREMTREPHLAGTEENKKLAQDLINSWKGFGFDSAELVKYDVLLSYPGGANNRNRAIIKAPNGTALHTTALEEKILDQAQNNSKVVPPFNAYSKGGPPVASHSLYYVNYGRAEDFEYLTRNRSINLTGSVVIARYGKIFRGNKVALAQQYGAVGILLYSDPADYAYGINSTYNSTFPYSWWLPPSGVQRGSTFIGNGDPLTPGYPAKEGVYRLTVEALRQMGEIPDIPCHPIGYEDAAAFLAILSGDLVSEAWKGKLNVQYRFGGRLTNRSIELQLHNTENITSIYNAIGVIRGQIEPDRYVLLGNHRDAWIFGSLDPSSGTASLLEVTRAFGELLKKGWRPRRTIIFCSWGAEEYGLIGSNEWVEEYVKNLGERAVAYINVDIAATYHYILEATGSALLHKALYQSAQTVPDPEFPVFKTIYDSWLNRTEHKDYGDKPLIYLPGSGSDHASFYQKVGIPCLDLTYKHNNKQWPISSYPLYHSVYETFLLVEKFVDPKFLWHQAMGRLWAVVAHLLVDSPLLPFDPVDYATVLQTHFTNFKDLNSQILQNISLAADVDRLGQAIGDFGKQTQDFAKKNLQDATILSNPYSLRRVNDQLMLLERAFTDPGGLPGVEQRKHMLYSQSRRDTYAGSAFPGVVDALYDIQYKTGEERERAIDDTRRQLARVLFAVESAKTTIEDVGKLYR